MADSHLHGRPRVESACDLCKIRKVKCDGNRPCGRCLKRRKPDGCQYTIPNRRKLREQQNAAAISPAVRTPYSPATSMNTSRTVHPPMATAPTPISTSTNADEDETAVPREARLLRDTQGRLVFIGDCAPMSFLQTVRQLVTTCVDPDAFGNQYERDAVLEQTESRGQKDPESRTIQIDPAVAATAVSNFFQLTHGLVDLFEPNRFLEDISGWLASDRESNVSRAAVYSIVLAIGLQNDNESLSANFFHRGRDIALANLAVDIGLETVQAFLLVSLYMLRSCQTNGGFLYFGFAARASYSIGLHRAEVNAYYGAQSQQQRHRLYKSLKVVDLFLSISLGRPPAITDADCTVPYRVVAIGPNSEPERVDATLQILLIIENIVEEVYHKRKISLKIADDISQQLKDWATRMLPPLQDLLKSNDPSNQQYMIGAFQTVATYYYGIMLLTRPFLMYDVYRVLKANSHPRAESPRSAGLLARRMRYTESCIDAACLLVDTVQHIMDRHASPPRTALTGPWLFTASLVLCVGLMGGLGRVLERYSKTTIAVFKFFSNGDAQAAQYASIAETLLKTTSEFVLRKDLEERRRKAKTSSDLFGMIHRAFSDVPSRHDGSEPTPHNSDSHTEASMTPDPSIANQGRREHVAASIPMAETSSSFGLETDFFTAGNANFWGAESENVFGSLNLFPSFETDGQYHTFIP